MSAVGRAAHPLRRGPLVRIGADPHRQHEIMDENPVDGAFPPVERVAPRRTPTTLRGIPVGIAAMARNERAHRPHGIGDDRAAASGGAAQRPVKPQQPRRQHQQPRHVGRLQRPGQPRHQP
jgi:hypothetical protein